METLVLMMEKLGNCSSFRVLLPAKEILSPAYLPQIQSARSSSQRSSFVCADHAGTLGFHLEKDWKEKLSDIQNATQPRSNGSPGLSCRAFPCGVAIGCASRTRPDYRAGLLSLPCRLRTHCEQLGRQGWVALFGLNGSLTGRP